MQSDRQTDTAPADDEVGWAAARMAMVDVVRRYGIKNPRVLAALGKVRRHRFIPVDQRRHDVAYADHPWSIGHGQTISQPYIVAYMTERLDVQAGDTVLEVGTGSGFQSAVLAELGATVFTIERLPELAEHARTVLAAEGYAGRVSVRVGDGSAGWPEQAPFDAIIVTCAAETVPLRLVEQLGEGGRMILPVGPEAGAQRLVIIRKHRGRVEQVDDLPVRFVPLIGGSSG